MPDFNEIFLEKLPEVSVAVLTLNRPQYHNALNADIRLEIEAAVDDVAADGDIGALVLIGGGTRAFSVGADLRDPRTDHSVSDFAEYIVGRRRRQRWYDILTHYPKGVVTAANGYVAGSGLQLALTGDVLIGTESAEFWVPQVALGLAPHVGTLVKLARIIGQQRMLSLILTGSRLSSRDAEAWGLLSEIVPFERLRERAIEVAAAI
ncbi:MAG TPA: enoyl-CoA hydratase/isomerase family protein, partial [Acidimicrobiales bacterium]|nr:enoyl-CoA hydratase/isomerase family protein [Acidimicrobiales bacterium]